MTVRADWTGEIALSLGALSDSDIICGLTITPMVVPSVPTGLQATVVNGQVALTWNGSTDAVNYHVKRGTTSGGPYTVIGNPATAAYTDTSVAYGPT